MDPPLFTASYAALPSIVFQCGNCRRIVGDTSELACTVSCGGQRLVVLRAVTGVTVDRISNQVATAGAGPAGRSFPVCCSGCGTALGSLYTETEPDLQCLVNNFTLDASKCFSYELGSSEIRVASQGGGPPQEAATPTGSQAHAAAALAQATIGDLAARVELLEKELLQMQGMLMLHDAQLQQLPGHLEQQQEEGGLPPGAAVALQQTGAGAGMQYEGVQYQTHLHTSMGGAG